MCNVSVSRTGPDEELAKQCPPISLVSPGPILSILSQMVIMVVPQVLIFLYIQQQPWYVRYPGERGQWLLTMSGIRIGGLGLSNNFRYFAG